MVPLCSKRWLQCLAPPLFCSFDSPSAYQFDDCEGGRGEGAFRLQELSPPFRARGWSFSAPRQERREGGKEKHTHREHPDSVGCAKAAQKKEKRGGDRRRTTTPAGGAFVRALPVLAIVVLEILSLLRLVAWPASCFLRRGGKNNSPFWRAARVCDLRLRLDSARVHIGGRRGPVSHETNGARDEWMGETEMGDRQAAKVPLRKKRKMAQVWGSETFLRRRETPPPLPFPMWLSPLDLRLGVGSTKDGPNDPSGSSTKGLGWGGV